MSDPLRTESARAIEGTPGMDRDAKIEQLLLLGLDHYFAARYEQAINVWTRALFLDRSHARARAYIERARTAMAERLRHSEELLHHGMAAFTRGDGDEARRLLDAAMHQGAPPDQALAILDRLNRLEQGTVAPPLPGPRAGLLPAPQPTALRSAAGRSGLLAWSAAGLLVAAAIAIFALPSFATWRTIFSPEAGQPAASTAPAAAEHTLPVPRRGETALVRARALAATGHLHDALSALDRVRPTDPQRAEADRLRGEIQQQLLAVGGSRP